MEVFKKKLSPNFEHIKQTVMYSNSKQIFWDDDYADIKGKLYQCPFCDSNALVETQVENNDEKIEEFFNSIPLNISKEAHDKEVERIYYSCHGLKSFDAIYCDDCKTILMINNDYDIVKEGFSVQDLMDMLIEDEVIDENENIYKCPECGGLDFKDTNIDKIDYWGTMVPAEYDTNCSNCGFYMGHYAYGYYSYHDCGAPEKRMQPKSKIKKAV